MLLAAAPQVVRASLSALEQELEEEQAALLSSTAETNRLAEQVAALEAQLRAAAEQQ